MIGASVRRVEDPALLRGKGHFAADTHLPGQLHMRVVRSQVAHGRLRSVRTSAALGAVGVVAVWTAEDVRHLPPIDFRLTPMEQLKPYRQPVLAQSRVRYVGEPVAVVFADSAYRAEDAAELVEVDIEPLPAVLDGSGDVFPWFDADEATAPHNQEQRTPPGDSECAIVSLDYGDVEGAFTAAERTVSVDVRVGRHSGVPLECRGVTAHVDTSSGVLIVDSAAKVPYWNRDTLASMLGLSPHNVHLREGDVGGGFGPRGELYPEDILVALAALRLKRPIKWIEDRLEHLMATNHSRDQRQVLRAAVDRHGMVTAIDAEFWADQGAYVRTHGATVASLTASMLPGPYVVPNYRVRGHIRMTNKTPAGTYRSPGRYEGTFARERLMDRIAAEMGMGRREIRHRNFISASEMPYQRPIEAMGTELIYDSGDYALLTKKVEDVFDLEGVRASVRSRREGGECVGIGYGWFVEKSGLGPYEGARVSVDTDGSVLLTTGTSSVGQGVDTVLSQVVAATLGVPIEKVRAIRGQTDRFGYGKGAFATRQSVMAGSASFRAAEAVRDKAIRVAAERLEVDPVDLECAEGAIRVVGSPGTGLELSEIARLLEPGGASRLNETPGLTADGWFHSEHMTYPYGIHVAVVRVDQHTGHPTVEKYVVGYDVGKALNHRLVEGQIAGGIAQGLGGALLEEFTYDDEGQPQSITFMDYLIPTSSEIPHLDILITEDAPSPLNPMGVKGAGEGGVTAAAAAIASAIDDALQSPGSVTSTPIRPEHLWRQLNGVDHVEDKKEI